MIEGGFLIPDAYQGSSDAYLRHAVSAPKANPMPLVPLLGQPTRGLGIIATMTTSFSPPYPAVTRQITSPTSSATSSEPSGPIATPTGRP